MNFILKNFFESDIIALDDIRCEKKRVGFVPIHIGKIKTSFRRKL